MDNSFFFYPKKDIKDVLCKNCIFYEACCLDSEFNDHRCGTYDWMKNGKKQNTVYLKDVDKYYTDKISKKRMVTRKTIQKVKK